jgi:hypothetical protein
MSHSNRVWLYFEALASHADLFTNQQWPKEKGCFHAKLEALLLSGFEVERDTV